MTIDDGKQLLRDRVASKEWYIIPGVSRAAMLVMYAVEHMYYEPGTEASADYEILTGMPYAYGVAMARKTRMTYPQLLEITGADQTGIAFTGTKRNPIQQDIVIACDPGSDGSLESALAHALFVSWAGCPQ